MREWTAARLAWLAARPSPFPVLQHPLLLGPLICLYGRFAIPNAHRHWLREQAHTFAVEVQRRWPGERFAPLTLRRWRVQPFLDLLNRPAGGKAYCGGPLFVPAQGLPALRHFRGERCIDDPLVDLDPAAQLPLPRLRGRWFWCGPVCHHFGHQIADFASRVLMASLDPRPGGLLWQRFGPGSDGPLHGWQRSILRYLNPGHKPIHWLEQAVEIQTLEVIPQQARMRAAPTLRHLAALTWLQQGLPLRPAIRCLYLSRSRFAACRSRDSLLGGYAGEAVLEAQLERQGVQVFHPQEHSVEDQLALYRAAAVIVVAEGSAQHGLELLGYNPRQQVLVICRRPQLPGMNLPLQARFPRVRFLQAVRELWMAEGGLAWNALAMLDLQQLAGVLAAFGFPLASADLAALELAAQEQLAELARSVPLVRLPA